jgi:hypothetical protein
MFQPCLPKILVADLFPPHTDSFFQGWRCILCIGYFRKGCSWCLPCCGQTRQLPQGGQVGAFHIRCQPLESIDLAILRSVPVCSPAFPYTCAPDLLICSPVKLFLLSVPFFMPSLPCTLASPQRSTHLILSILNADRPSPLPSYHE